MRVYTLPVYSRNAEADEVRALGLSGRLPFNDDGTPWRLSRHQVATYRALVRRDADVVFNTAMTGDGKSLAGQLPALLHGGASHAVMAMYPTNELIRDQDKQFAATLPHWNADLLPRILNSAELDAIDADGIYSSRGESLLERVQTADVLLTNPDIFHLVMHQFYTRRNDAPDKVFGPVLQRFAQFTFDEFHIFETPQVVSVLNAMLLIHACQGPMRPHTFLFLSATPGDLMKAYLRRSGLRVTEISGEYAHSKTVPDSDEWRPILKGTTLDIAQGGVEDWIAEHLDDTLLPFFKDRGRHAKGAVIVNSVAAAYRLLPRLRQALEPYGLRVAPNTGLTTRADRKASYDADLLVGTSTVDVGVDFAINFLLFESRDAGSFIQRLGRLGRHATYERDGESIPFHDFQAYALVPPWVHEALFVGREQAPPLLLEGATVDRESLNRAILVAYPSAATFEHYAHHWGKLQTVHILRGLTNPTVREQYRNARPALEQRYAETFGISVRAALGQYKEQLKTQKCLWEEAISFRGGSYFTCGVIDESQQKRDVIQADLFQLAGSARLAALDESVFYAAVEEAKLSRYSFERQKLLAFYRLLGWEDERRAYTLYLDRDIRYWGADRFDQAAVITGWQIDAELPGLTTLNRHLHQRKLPALLCRGVHPLDLKRRLRLPLLFGVVGFVSRDGIEGSVAFGREALLLDTRLHYRPLSHGSTATIL